MSLNPTALQTYYAEAGGLGARPVGTITTAGNAAQMAALTKLIAAGNYKRAAEIVNEYQNASGAVQPQAQSPFGALGVGVAGLAAQGESASLGGLVGPLGILGSDLQVLIESAFAGRPRNAATIATLRVLLASQNPEIRAVGAAINRVLRAGLVTSSPAAAAIIRPALGAAVKSLIAQGYDARQVRQLFANAFAGKVGSASLTSLQPVASPLTTRQLPGARAAGLRPGAVVHDMRSFGGIAPSEAATVASQYEAPAAVATEVGPTIAAADLAPLTRAAQIFGVEQAGTAVYRLVRGEPLDAAQFGSLAGVIVGGLAGDPAAGAQVGLEVGTVVQTLQDLSQRYFGRTLDSLVGQAGRGALATLRSLTTAQPQPSPAPAPAAREIVSQPQPSPTPTPSSREIVSQPEAQQTLAEQQRAIEQQLLGQQRGVIPPPPAGQMLNHQPGGCYSPAQIAELLDCPNFQKQLQEKFTVTPAKNGQPGQIVAKQPLCVCCDSAADLILYTQTNGLSGACIQMAAPAAELATLAAATQGG